VKFTTGDLSMTMNTEVNDEDKKNSWDSQEDNTLYPDCSHHIPVCLPVGISSWERILPELSKQIAVQT